MKQAQTGRLGMTRVYGTVSVACRTTGWLVQPRRSWAAMRILRPLLQAPRGSGHSGPGPAQQRAAGRPVPCHLAQLLWAGKMTQRGRPPLMMRCLL